MTLEVEASALNWSQDYQLPNPKYVSLQARLIGSAPKILSILSCLALSNLSVIGVALGIDPYNHFGAPPPPSKFLQQSPKPPQTLLHPHPPHHRLQHPLILRPPLHT